MIPKIDPKHLIPLADRVIVELDELPTITKSGIHLVAKQDKETQTVGIVTAVGEGLKDEAMCVQIGQKVIFSKYAGTFMDFEDDDSSYKFLRQSDIIAIMVEPESKIKR